jgi:RNA polymerase sigma factor (sigma-70 family)
MRHLNATDNQLVQQVRHGNTDAFNAIVRRHRSWVCRLLQSFTGDANKAEDLAQEVFTRLYRHLCRHTGSYKENGAFVAFLKRIAINVGRTYVSRETQRQTISWEEVGEANEPSESNIPLASLLTRQLEEEMRLGLSSLSAEQREAIVLRFFAGLTVPEIAEKTGVAPGTIKSRLFYGLQRLRTYLENQKETEQL